MLQDVSLTSVMAAICEILLAYHLRRWRRVDVEIDKRIYEKENCPTQTKQVSYTRRMKKG